MLSLPWRRSCCGSWHAEPIIRKLIPTAIAERCRCTPAMHCACCYACSCTLVPQLVEASGRCAAGLLQVVVLLVRVDGSQHLHDHAQSCVTRHGTVP